MKCGAAEALAQDQELAALLVAGMAAIQPSARMPPKETQLMLKLREEPAERSEVLVALVEWLVLLVQILWELVRH